MRHGFTAIPKPWRRTGQKRQETRVSACSSRHAGACCNGPAISGGSLAFGATVEANLVALTAKQFVQAPPRGSLYFELAE